MNWVLENWDTVVAGIAALLALATIVVELTATEEDDKVLAKVKKVWNYIVAKKDNK